MYLWPMISGYFSGRSKHYLGEKMLMSGLPYLNYQTNAIEHTMSLLIKVFCYKHGGGNWACFLSNTSPPP